VAAFSGMLKRDRERLGLREARAAWLAGVSVREYRELEAGGRWPTFETWDRICKLYGRPQTFVGATVKSGGEADLLVAVGS
jgi:transcriptional regulator with XRE-family HTH domain